MTETDDVTEHEPEPMECRRCGVCCTIYQPILDNQEVQVVADYLNMDIAAWIEKYTDPRWGSSRNYLVQHVNGACAFLQRDGAVTTCTVHPARPACCRDWQASPEKKECRTGME